MNPSSRPGRPVATLSSRLDKALCSYSLAAQAAGVGLLAIALPCEAKIVYTPTHHVITRHGSFNLDLNKDGVIDFTLQNYYMVNTSTLVSALSVKPAQGNGAQGWVRYAFDLKAGSRIGAGDYFPGQQLASVNAGPAAVYYIGSWVNVKNRYLGLKFRINDKVHFGWARLSVSIPKGQYKVIGTLTGYAYETVPKKPIVAGKTKGDDVIVMPAYRQPATLGHLALGRR